MNRIAGMCLVVAALFALPSASNAQQAQVRLTHELTARQITLPPTDPGLLSVLGGNCSGCASLSLNTSERTRYMLNAEVVSLNDLRLQLQLNPDAMVLLSLEKSTQKVKLVRLYAAPSTAR